MTSPSLRDFSDPSFNPDLVSDLAYGSVVDPWPKLREIAAHGRVQEADFRQVMGLAADTTTSGERIFMVFDHADIRRILSTPEIFTNDYYAVSFGSSFGILSLPVLNPPEHTHYRRIFQKAFIPSAVASWPGEFIDPVIHELIDGFLAYGHVELIEAFVARYAFEVVYRYLSLPAADAKLFHKLSVALQLGQVDLPHGREAHDKLGEYFQALIDLRRREPGSDLISLLATVEVEGEHLPDEAVISFLRSILGAAGDTAYRTTGSMLVGLLVDRPEQFEMLKADRTLIPKAIEETLRWEGPINVNYRMVARDVELSGVAIPAGAIVQSVLGLANRDPAIFPDPDRFDLTRPQSGPHFGFGNGPHLCLGRHLARLEMMRAMDILLDRLPKLRLDPAHPRPAIVGATMRSPKQIYVRFD